jgi:hypothetical protein
MTDTDETPSGDECAVCHRPLAVTDTINYNRQTRVLRCMDCEFLPVPRSSRYDEITTMSGDVLRREAERTDLSDADRWMIDDELGERDLARASDKTEA